MVKGLFDSLRGEMASTRLAEDKLYEIVLAELKAGDIDEVAKARATKDAKGEESKADALYIKHRIRRINDEHSSNLMAAKKGVSETLCMRFSPCGLDGSFIEPFWV